MGPWIVTADEIDPQHLDISCKVNEEFRQHANTSDMIFDVATLIETISKGITLRTGDIIATGTPAGVGAGFKPPRFLKRDDVVSITIEKIGTLTNRVA
jgi:2-keto-4-pentenoate hydratase/2-oxohepta-3-ene-1,7-dioic acid hydratase in catechol pathway